MALLQKLWAAPPVDKPGELAGIKGSLKKGFNFQASSTGMMAYSLPHAEFVSLKLYDLNGSLQSDVVSQNQAAGNYSINRQQMNVKPGLYLVKFQVGGYSQNQMVYLGQ
jgi:hypothetical protein